MNPHAGRPSRIETATLVVAIACTIVIVILHVRYALKAGELWRDEAASVQFATMRSISEIYTHLEYDNFPPLLLGIVRAWTHAGFAPSDMGYRALGFLIGLGVVGAFWLNARLVGDSVPMMSLVLFGLSPLAIRVGDSMRPYGLGLLFIILARALIWRLVVAPGLYTFVLAACMAVLSVQALYQNALILLAVCTASALVAAKGGHWRCFALVIATGATAALSLTPYLGIIARAQDWSVLNRGPVTLSSLVSVMTSALEEGGQGMLIAWWVFAILAAGFGLIAGMSRFGFFAASDRRRLLCQGITLVLVPGIFFGFLRLLGMPTQPWYYLLPACVVALAIDEVFALAALRGGGVKALRPLIAAVLFALGIFGAWQGVAVRQTNADLVASKLSAVSSARDLVLVNPWYYAISLARYYKGPATIVPIPPIDDVRIHRYDLVKRKMMERDPLGPLLTRCTDVLRSGGRIWVVGWLSVPAAGQQAPLLPPAPQSEWGWSEPHYALSWTLQLGQLLAMRAMRASPIAVDIPGSVNPLENLELLRVEGWRASGSGVSAETSEAKK